MSLCLIGGSGFVGSRALALAKGPVRTLAHRRPLPDAVQGDAADPAALERLLEPGSVVLNFAYQAGAAERLAEALGAACAVRKVRRLVHVSTVSVYGAAPGRVIDEDTPCEPRMPYEREKHAAEQILERHARGRFELVVLRPAAVFGPGGRNLETLARRVLRQPWPLRYARACLMGRRRMHAVDVELVAAAAQFAAQVPLPGGVARFIVSQDEELANDYAAIEAFFAWRFRRRNPLPPLALPAGLLAAGLRLAGRSDAEPQRRYSSARLLGSGFRPPRPFAAALEEYAAWIESRARP
jgi:nucleoside-diphosphate-sugar epimerase